MLPEIRIASPCTATWESMTGDDRSRHCSDCSRTVYNFAAMTSAEIEQLIAASNGERLCGRLYRHDDGTILTRDCPVGLRTRIRRVSRRLGAALVAAMSFACTAKAVPQQTAPTIGDDMVGDVAVAQSGFNLFAVQNESPIAQAQITVIDRKTHKTIATGKTDDGGKFGLALALGEYTILVQRVGLVSQSLAVSIKQYKTEQLTVRMQDARIVMGMVALPVLRDPSKRK